MDYKDKFNMTQEQNVFFAKRNVVDYIWKSANMEGIAVTFPETQTIYDGGNVSKLRVDEIVTINNLKHAWQFILATINDNIDFNYLSSIHSLVGSNLVEAPGKLRVYQTAMGGTKWKPEIPNKEKIEEILKEENGESITESAITLMLKLMKAQAFNDGNKRTSMLIANHEMIKNGKGVITIAQEHKTEFGEKLIKYYETDDLEEIKKFIYDKCIFGI